MSSTFFFCSFVLCFLFLFCFFLFCFCFCFEREKGICVAAQAAERKELQKKGGKWEDEKRKLKVQTPRIIIKRKKKEE